MQGERWDPLEAVASLNRWLGTHPVLVHEGWQDGEGRASLCHNGDGNGCADTVLPLLYLEVVEERDQDILGADCFGDVAKCIDSGAPDALLVRLGDEGRNKSEIDTRGR